jgi:hypothetical protein
MPEVHTSSVVKSPLTPFIPGGGFSKGGNHGFKRLTGIHS